MISYCFQRRLSQVTIESLGITWICVLEDFTHVGCEGHKVSFCLRRLDLQFISCKHGRASRWRCVRVSVQSARRRGILTVFDVRLTRFLAAFGGSQGQVGVGSVGRTRGYDHTSYVAHVKMKRRLVDWQPIRLRGGSHLSCIGTGQPHRSAAASAPCRRRLCYTNFLRKNNNIHLH